MKDFTLACVDLELPLIQEAVQWIQVFIEGVLIVGFVEIHVDLVVWRYGLLDSWSSSYVELFQGLWLLHLLSRLDDKMQDR